METEQTQVPVKVRKKPGPKPRNKTGAGTNTTEVLASHAQVTPDRATQAHTPDRPERIAMGAVGKLDVAFALDRENFFYYWFNEDQFDQAKQAWYEAVKHPESGEVVKRTYKGMTSILMKLPIQYRKEDLIAKREKVINTLSADETGGVDRKNGLAPEYSGIEGRKGAIEIKDSGFDPNESPFAS